MFSQIKKHSSSNKSLPAALWQSLFYFGLLLFPSSTETFEISLEQIGRKSFSVKPGQFDINFVPETGRYLFSVTRWTPICLPVYRDCLEDKVQLCRIPKLLQSSEYPQHIHLIFSLESDTILPRIKRALSSNYKKCKWVEISKICRFVLKLPTNWLAKVVSNLPHQAATALVSRN